MGRLCFTYSGSIYITEGIIMVSDLVVVEHKGDNNKVCTLLEYAHHKYICAILRKYLKQ